MPQLNCPQNDWITLPSCHRLVAHPFLSLLSGACVCMVGCWVDSSSGGRLRPRHFLFDFFCHLICRPKWHEYVLPIRPALVASHLKKNFHHRHCLLVGCWVFQLIGGHVRPGPHPSIYFLMGHLFGAPGNPQNNIKPTEHTWHCP
jgi:hypothetical protein